MFYLRAREKGSTGLFILRRAFLDDANEMKADCRNSDSVQAISPVWAFFLFAEFSFVLDIASRDLVTLSL